MTATTYEVTIGERTVRVRVRREREQVFAQVDDGPEVPVSLRTVRGVQRVLTVGEQRSEVLAARTSEGIELALNGLGYIAEVQDEAHARLARVTGARGGSQGRRELKAPMPGLVVKVLVDSGAEVAAGQPLVVLQAMKMENELALPRGGIVQSVAVSAGDTVESGQVLVVVE